jgi:membrane-associated phospholipid phosphatase
VAVAVLLLVLGIAVLVDDVVAAWATRLKAPLLDLLVGVINPIGSGVILLAVCLALALLSRAAGRSRLHDASVLAALAFASAGLVEFTLKHLVGRPRPVAALTVGLIAPSPAEIDSFPSGHATSVFAVATVFAAYYPGLRWPLYGLAAAIALGRVYLERHYVSDIVAGAAIGMAFAIYLYRRRYELPPRLILESPADAPR